MSRSTKKLKPIFRGVEYKSGIEADVAKQLYINKVQFIYEDPSSRIEFYYEVPNAICRDCGESDIIKPAHYTPDFCPNNILLEVKGILDVGQRRKFTAIKNSRPELDLRFVFQRDNWITTRKKTTYVQWAENLGFKACVKIIPYDWYEDLV